MLNLYSCAIKTADTVGVWNALFVVVVLFNIDPPSRLYRSNPCDSCRSACGPRP